MRDEFEIARKQLGIEVKEFQLVSPHKHVKITERLVARFTTLGKDGSHAMWWWESFRVPSKVVECDDALKAIANLIDTNAFYWFAAQANAPKKESGFWLYKAKGWAILRILWESHYCEYYISDLRMNSILCEDHHGILIQCGDPFKKPAPNNTLQGTLLRDAPEL